MINIEQIKSATEKKFSHSSGPGGQNVNKTATKVQLSFDIQKSALDDEEKRRLMQKFPDGEIHVYSQETRSQHRNQELAFEHLSDIIVEALRVEKKRRGKKPPHLTRAGKIKKILKDKLMKYRKRRIDQ